MLTKITILFLVFSLTLSVFSQIKPAFVSTKPKLIVGIVVDQMRNDYIYRYWSRYGNGGFKRLVNDGYYFKNAHFNYIPTYTGPGHCSIYTGTAPRTHGIIANDWFVKTNNTGMYCTQDTIVKTVGSTSKAGLMSPKNQLTSTIGDELKMTTNKKGKVFAVALKDRSSILPAGHAADAAFWFDEGTGDFISSTWYVNELPNWLQKFNEKKLAKSYLEKGWNTLFYPESYTSSIADDNNYEMVPNKQDKPVFPYSYKTFLDKKNVGIIRSTPFGNSITKDVAIECLKNEQLGKDDICDLFSISFSSTDIVAHSYGPRSVEVEDVYLRLDKDIEELLNALDKEVGKGNYTLFLTADHGGADVPNHLKDSKIPAGYLKDAVLIKDIKNYFQKNYTDTSLLTNISNEQVFLNDKKIEDLKLNKDDVEQKLANYLVTIIGIAEAYPSKVMKNSAYENNDYKALLQNGYNHKLSGNICYILNPAWMDFAEKGTTHGAGYNYDTHVPVLFYGNGIKKGSSYNYISITQIAPTICELIQINQPNGCVSNPLNDFFK